MLRSMFIAHLLCSYVTLLHSEQAPQYNVTTILKQASTYTKQGQYMQAIDTLHRSLDTTADTLLLQRELGYLYLKTHNVHDALHHLIQAHKKDPSHATTCTNIGVAYYMQKDFTNAEIWYKKALSCDTNHALTYTNLGNLYLTRNQIRNAIEILEKAIDLDQNNSIAHFNLGCALQADQCFEGAEKSFRMAIMLDRTYIKAYFKLVELLIQQKETSEALKTFHTALQACAHAPNHHTPVNTQ